MDFKGEEYGCCSLVQMQPGQGQDNPRSMTQSQHQGPDMGNHDWPINELDHDQDTIEENYHPQQNLDDSDQNHSTHPIELKVIKPEELVEEGEEEQHRGTVKVEDDTEMQIEKDYYILPDTPNCDLNKPEHLKMNNEEAIEELESFGTDHSETLMQIQDYSPGTSNGNSARERISSELCIQRFDGQICLSSSERSPYNGTLANSLTQNPKQDCNELASVIENTQNNRGTCFNCEFCDHSCKTSSQLRLHLKTHTREKTFSCDFCEYKANKKSNLNRHFKTHTGEKPYSCDFCEYKAAHKANLIIHLNRHTGERPFSCNLCEYNAAQKSSLNAHLKSHTGEKPYSCDFCEYKSTLKLQLTNHLKTHTRKNPTAVTFVITEQLSNQISAGI